ncbi:bifunctional glutamate N-acetyltransferase/amino-acid acetyltransferase ArgJ [Pikeienuella sp. HZG-20]|uniref:bifunctional glutamate N-acetyltransferase/amino-acid acetyltransferase ArgJ n=1 Tax=Paludibacillus litoralis TaxID=3133267 RepID=UPI0030EF3CE9
MKEEAAATGGTSTAEKIALLKDRAAALRKDLADVERELAALDPAAAGGGTAKATPASPFARAFPDLPVVKGVRFAAVAAGVRYRGRKDVMLAEIAPGAAIAGVFTRSSTRSAPVDWCRARLAGLEAAAPKGPLAIVVNSGNANAFTGGAGMKGVERVAAAAAAAVGGEPAGVFIASTGVIGEPLPAERITAKLDELAAALSPGAGRAAADAIMTTDTFAKGAGRTIDLGGVPVAIAGFAKGSGMIAPDMATMLGFVFTDAPVGRALLQEMVSDGTTISFNAATVDGDTSTSDTLLVAATGAAGGAPILSRDDPRAAPFEAALREVLVDLAQQIVRDGEGISKYVAVKVTGAASDASAAIVARAIANSPLVKTAVAGEDPNWGRIVMAVGKSGEPAERDRLSIRLGDILVAENGWIAPGYREEAGAAYMKGDEIEITADLGVGAGEAVVWTCDLTHRYIEINADYRS